MAEGETEPVAPGSSGAPDASASVGSSSHPPSRKSKLLSATERRRVAQSLASIKAVDVAGSTLASAAEEKHMSYFPARKESLANDTAAWHSIVGYLPATYANIYKQCSTQAEKYMKLPVMWTKAVSQLYPDDKVRQLKLSELDRCSTLHAVAAAVWNHCCYAVKKTIECSNQTEDQVSKPALTEDHIKRFFGAALHRSIHALVDKEKRRGKANTEDEEKLKLLRTLRLLKEEKELSNLPMSLRIRDRGWMAFLREEYMEYAKHAMESVVEVINQSNFKRYGSDFVKVSTTTIKCDKPIMEQFEQAVTKHQPGIHNSSIVEACGQMILLKVVNAMCQEVIDACEQVQVVSSGASSTSGQNLRPSLHIANV